MTYRIFLLLFYLQTVDIVAQTFDYYNLGLKDDQYHKALEDTKGNLYIFGLTQWNSNENYCPFLTILDKDGYLIRDVIPKTNWTYVAFYDIIWSEDSNFVAVGHIRESSALAQRPYIVKFNQDFEVIWEMSFHLSKEYNHFSRIRLDLDHSQYFLCGSSFGYDPIFQGDAIAAEFDLNGGLKVFKVLDLGKARIFEMSDMLRAIDGKYIGLAISDSRPGPGSSTYFIILNSSFELDTAIDHSDHSPSAMFLLDYSTMEWIDSSNLMVHGSVMNQTDMNQLDDDRDMGLYLFNYYTYEHDTTYAYGDPERWDWSSNSGLSFVDTASIFTVINHDMTLDYLYPDNHKSRFYVVNVNSTGVRNWDRYYTNNAHIITNSITATRDRGAIICGFSYLHGYNGPEERDAYALKIGPNGEASITPAGISNNIQNSDIRLFPNPNNGSFHLKLPQSYLPGKVSIFSHDGILRYKNEVSEIHNDLETNLHSGLYILRFEGKGVSSFQRFMVE